MHAMRHGVRAIPCGYVPLAWAIETKTNGALTLRGGAQRIGSSTLSQLIRRTQTVLRIKANGSMTFLVSSMKSLGPQGKGWFWSRKWSGGNAHAAVLEDFAKLLVARAGMRVMVCNQDHAPIDELAEYVRLCHGSHIGDTYLIVGFAANDLVYHRIDVMAPGEVVVQQLL